MIETAPATEFRDQPPTAELATVLDLRPDIDQTVFLLEQTELPTFADTAVQTAKVLRRSDLDNKDAKYYQRKLTFTDGTRRDDIYGQANHPVSDIIIDSSPAWWTPLDRGINKITSAKLNELGFSTHRTGIAFNRAHSLYRNAWDMHTTLESLEVSFDVDTKKILLEGDSNGGNTGTGELAYSEAFKREVVGFFLEDPCLANKIGAPLLRKLLLHPEYLGREAFCLGKQGVRTIREEDFSARELIRTASTSPSHILANLMLTRALAWGELKHLAAHVPDDQTGVFYFFKHSIANEKSPFGRIIRGSAGNARPGINIEQHRGVHLSIVNPRTINAKQGYFADQRDRLVS